jgi:hypothetical protein
MAWISVHHRSRAACPPQAECSHEDAARRASRLRPVSGLAIPRLAFPRDNAQWHTPRLRSRCRDIEKSAATKPGCWNAIAYRCGGSTGWRVRADFAPCFPFNWARRLARPSTEVRNSSSARGWSMMANERSIETPCARQASPATRTTNTADHYLPLCGAAAVRSDAAPVVTSRYVCRRAQRSELAAIGAKISDHQRKQHAY